MAESGGRNVIGTRFGALGEWEGPHLKIAGRIGIVGLAGALAYLTWAHWGNMLVDSGRELYVPAEILRGKLLYRDLWYPLGPLAPYVEAILLKVFGLHFSVLYTFGLVLTIASALVLFEIGALLEEARAGLAAAMIFLLQGFSPSIFNYVFPYAYAATLGLTLTLFCALFALRVVLNRSRTLLFAGVAVGLALLSKREFGAACCVFLAFILVTESVLKGSAKPLIRGVWQLLPGAALCLLVYGWFFLKLTPAFIVFENWTEFPGAYGSKVYGAYWHARWGLRFIPKEWAVLILNAGSALYVWSLIARIRAYIGPVSFALAISCMIFIIAFARHLSVFNIPINVMFAITFPIGMYFVGCGIFGDALRRLYHHPASRLVFALAAFSLLAITLAVRVLAMVVPFAYSVFYDPPLILVFVFAVTKFAQLAVRYLTMEQARVVVGSVLAAQVALFACSVFPGVAGRTEPLKTDWGSIYLLPADARNAREIMDFILRQKREGREVLLLPESPMLYALTGTESPVRWYTLTPGVLSPAQEEKYILALGARPPEYVVLNARCTEEYGVPYFGIDYNRRIGEWIERNYQVVREVGKFRRDGTTANVAALIYKRKATAG
jgi:Dolichyl-phosphate-mannose-protein mannosyltransferase